MVTKGPDPRDMFKVDDMVEGEKKKELGVLNRSNLSPEELNVYEQRAKSWNYMVDFDHMEDAIGRYAQILTTNIYISGVDGAGGGGFYNFTSKEVADNLNSILFHAKSREPPHSHVDLKGSAGGKFYIAKDSEEARKLKRSPWHKEENFLKMYALASLYGHKTWLVERLRQDDIFRFFIDLDFNQPGVLLPQKIEAVVFIVVRAVSKFFPRESDELLQCICSSTVCKVSRCEACLCECKGLEKDCEQCKGVGNTGKKGANACSACRGEFPVKKKTGIHLHFPRIFVTAVQAFDMRETVIAECIRVWGFRSAPFNPWTDVIDESVYKKNGLRMIGASKADYCKECKAQKPGEMCKKCGNSRRVDQGRPYFPLACFNGQGLRDKATEEAYEQNFIQLIIDTSIRYFGDSVTEGYALYEGAPTSATSIKQKSISALQSKQSGKKRVLSETGNLLSHQLALDAPEVRAIQSFFSEQSCREKHCSPMFSELVVSQVKYKNKDACYKVDVTGKNSRYCLNKGDYHGGNRVYFLFQASTKDHSQGVVQKCYCEKEQVRKYSACSDYTSSPMTMSHKVSSILFSTTTEAQKEEASVLTRMDFRGMSREARSQNQLLLNAGNFLSKELYNTMWTNSPRFSSMFGSAMLETALPQKLSVYRPFKMDSVGPDDDKTLFDIVGVALHHEEEKVLRILSTGTLEDLSKGIPESPDFNIQECMNTFIKESQRLKNLHANVSGSQGRKELSFEERKQLCKEMIQTMQKKLIDLMTYRHDAPMENSRRHGGYGWSLEIVDKQFREKTREIIKHLHETL